MEGMKSWPELTRELNAQIRNLRGGAPEVMKAFSSIAQTALAPKALDRNEGADRPRHRGGDTLRRLHCLSRQGRARARRLSGRSRRSARHGHLHRRRVFGDVREPCARSV